MWNTLTMTCLIDIKKLKGEHLFLNFFVKQKTVEFVYDRCNFSFQQFFILVYKKMCSIGNTFSVNSNLFSDSKGNFKIYNKKGMFCEVARYFRKSYDCCRCCGNCIYCFAYNFTVGQMVFHRINFFHKNVLWKVYLNTNYIGLTLVSMDQF